MGHRSDHLDLGNVLFSLPEVDPFHLCRASVIRLAVQAGHGIEHGVDVEGHGYRGDLLDHCLGSGGGRGFGPLPASADLVDHGLGSGGASGAGSPGRFLARGAVPYALLLLDVAVVVAAVALDVGMGLAIEAGSAAVLVGSFLLRAAAPPAICIAIPAASAALASLALSVLALAFPISSFSALSILGLVTLARSPSSGGSRLASAGALGVIGDLDAESLDRLGQVGSPVLATGLV